MSVEVLKDFEKYSLVVDRDDWGTKFYKIPFESESAKREFLSKANDGYRIAFTEEALTLDWGEASSSIASYYARWEVIQGYYEVLWTHDWKWESGTAGGSGTKGKYKFAPNSIVAVNRSGERILYVIGNIKDYIKPDRNTIEYFAKEVFPKTWKEWANYVEKERQFTDMEYLYKHLRNAREELEEFFGDEEKKYTPENYKVLKKARERRIFYAIGTLPLRFDALKDLVDLVETEKWEYWEIQWLVRGKPPHSGFIEILWRDDVNYSFDREVIKFARKLSKKYECRTVEILDFIKYRLDLEKVEGVVIRKGKGLFEYMELAYCDIEDWEKVKKQLEEIIVKELENLYDEDEDYYDEDEDWSPSP